MADLNLALERLERLNIEGGYVNNPADRGGPTKYGITQAEALRHGYTGDMRDLPLELAHEFYRADYWAPLRLDEFTSQALANVVFDFSANAGVGTAARMLQRALGLDEDGILGEHTLTAANLAGDTALGAFESARKDHYEAIVRADPTQARFLKGWFNRAEKPALLPEVAA